MNLEKYLKVNKKIGETPLEALERVRLEYGVSKVVPMTYAGRLDPMAEGLLLILVGEECKQKERYLGLDKEYEVEVLLGFGTDTGDLLGVVKGVSEKLESEIQKEKVEEFLKSFVGKFKQEYPVYSSKTVEGKQLHEYARANDLPDEMPTKEVEIFNIEFLGERKISNNELLNYIEENIAKVKGDFRQSEIISIWRKILQDLIFNIPLIHIRVSCSSGTYMRVLAEKIGEKFKTNALVFSIKRTKIGNFKL